MEHKIFDDKAVTRGYESVPLIEIDKLPRGGITLETAAVGRIQVSARRERVDRGPMRQAWDQPADPSADPCTDIHVWPGWPCAVYGDASRLFPPR